MRKNIEDWIADEYPVATIARKAGVTRQDVYCYLTPSRYRYRLTDEKLSKIAEFEGRSLHAVKSEYDRRRAA